MITITEEYIIKAIEVKMLLDVIAETDENRGIKAMNFSYASRQLQSVYSKV